MSIKAKACCVVGALGLGLIAAPAAAQGLMPWAPYPGQAVDFTHFGGGSDNGAAGFGVPNVYANVFDFTPPAFNTSSGVGSSDSIDDRMQVDVTPNGANFNGTTLTVIESGTITGDMTQNLNGGIDSIFTIDGNITVLANASIFPAVLQAPMDIEISVIDANTATWTGRIELDLSAQILTGFLPVTEARIVLENVLTARSFNGVETTVTKDSAQVYIPTPAGVSVLGLGLLAATRRRR